MLIRELRTYNYRNLVDSRVEFSPGINVVIGNNGQGKTNLVEAVSLISHARSFRTSNTKDLVKFDKSEASVFGVIERQASVIELGVAIENGKRSAIKNGEKLESLEEFIGNFICISFSPSDLEIIKGPPSLRRRFLDKHCVDYERSILHQLVKYQGALKHKQSLISENSLSATPAQLEPWNKLLAESAEAISSLRYRFISELESKVKQVYREISPASEEIALRLESDIEMDAKREQIFERFSKAAESEISSGRIRFGPHRDDLAIIISEVDARSFASQGQTRSITIALKLGVLELIRERISDSPVVLLDDVDSELDADRLRGLYDVVLAGHEQVLITATQVPKLLEDNHERGSALRKMFVKQGYISEVLE